MSKLSSREQSVYQAAIDKALAKQYPNSDSHGVVTIWVAKVVISGKIHTIQNQNPSAMSAALKKMITDNPNMPIHLFRVDEQKLLSIPLEFEDPVA